VQLRGRASRRSKGSAQRPGSARTRSRRASAPERELPPQPLPAPVVPDAIDPLPAPAPQAVPRAGAPRLVLVGDSLAEGVEPWLSSVLPGWAIAVDGETGRTLDAGMARVRALDEVPTVLAVSLFTNDSPSRLPQLEAAVRETIARQAGRGCAVWATVVRPPDGGRSYAEVNAALRRLAGERPDVLRLVDWEAAVAANPALLGRDRVHATQAGYRQRAALFAQAAAECAGL